MKASIIMADDGIVFDGRVKDERPLGGAETAFAELAEALARRGHKVEAYCRCESVLDWKGVRWAPLADDRPDLGVPAGADLYIANRSHRLIGLCPLARREIFWIHNPAGYLLKPRYQWPLFRRRPTIVFGSRNHLSTYPAWAFGGGREVVPLGITPVFMGGVERCVPPPPVALFLSNPLRSLDWLLEAWADRIRPQVPEAELHVFAGASIYGAVGAAKAEAMGRVLDKARALANEGVVLRGPVAKARLAAEMSAARIFLYRGDIGETFCNAAAEPQAMGLPGVVEDVACMKERVQDGKTGFVVSGQQAFAAAAVRLLTDDALWLAQHKAALASQRSWGWDEAAAAFERIGAIA